VPEVAKPSKCQAVPVLPIRESARRRRPATQLDPRAGVETRAMARSAVAFVAAVAVFATAFAPRRGLPARPLAAARRRAPAALHMNMFDRFKRVAKANANNLLGKRVAPRRTENRALVF
jgi:hypothetical protein